MVIILVRLGSLHYWRILRRRRVLVEGCALDLWLNEADTTWIGSFALPSKVVGTEINAMAS